MTKMPIPSEYAKKMAEARKRIMQQGNRGAAKKEELANIMHWYAEHRSSIEAAKQWFRSYKPNRKELGVKAGTIRNFIKRQGLSFGYSLSHAGKPQNPKQTANIAASNRGVKRERFNTMESWYRIPPEEKDLIKRINNMMPSTARDFAKRLSREEVESLLKKRLFIRRSIQEELEGRLKR